MVIGVNVILRIPAPPVTGGGVTTPPVTDTETASVALPPAPVQYAAYVRDAVSAPVLNEPVVPVREVVPSETAQLVAPVEVQLIVADPPEETDVGEAVISTVGAGVERAPTFTVTLCVPLPPAPVQVAV